MGDLQFRPYWLALSAVRGFILCQGRLPPDTAKGVDVANTKLAKPLEGLDYAWTHVPIDSLVARGTKFVCRYLSTDAAKDLSAAEAKQLAAKGIWMAVVYETTASRATAGRLAGRDDATAALKKATALGMPKDRPIYFAVDYDSAGWDVVSYFDGIRDVLPLGRIGAYAGRRCVKYLHDNKKITWVWQTYAWSGGLWFDPTHIQQYHNGIDVGGVNCDADRAITEDYGQWMPGKSPAKPQVDKGIEVQFGQLKSGKSSIDIIAFPVGTVNNIAFGADNGLQSLPAAQIRVAVRDAQGWDTHVVAVEGNPKDKNGKATPVQTIVHFRDPKTTGVVSVRREDAGNVLVAWEVS